MRFGKSAAIERRAFPNYNRERHRASGKKKEEESARPST
jgi:hypothetical protein